MAGFELELNVSAVDLWLSAIEVDMLGLAGVLKLAACTISSNWRAARKASLPTPASLTVALASLSVDTDEISAERFGPTGETSPLNSAGKLRFNRPELRTRWPAWESYVVDAFNRYPWMKARGLAGIGGILEMIAQYSALMDRLLGSWRFPPLRLAARPQNYPERTDALIEWLARKGSSPKSP